MASTGVRFDLPTPDCESQPFWDGLREGKLLIQRCLDCKGSFFYARPFCPVCWSDRVEWFAASGKGTLMGSMAHGHANRAAVKNAMYDVITGEFNGDYTPDQAVKALVSAVASAKQ